jgi:hypothetical protein
MMWSECCSLRMPTVIPDTIGSKCYSCPATVYWTLALSSSLDARRLVPLELPGREAPDVDVELVEARVVAVVGKLDLEL